jgi:hypothetical protein
MKMETEVAVVGFRQGKIELHENLTVRESLEYLRIEDWDEMVIVRQEDAGSAELTIQGLRGDRILNIAHLQDENLEWFKER